MTIIAILLAFALCHFVRELGQLRRHQWLGRWIQTAEEFFGRLPAWNEFTGFALILFIPLIGLALLNQLFMGLFGNLGVFLLGVAVLVYCFGQRDLDTQVADIIQSGDEIERDRSLIELLQTELSGDANEVLKLSVNAVFRESLRRWFGVIFWFALLGILGAFLFRMVDWLSSEKCGLSAAQKLYFMRTRQVLEWPVAQLMTLSLAIATDFDSVFIAWKKYHDEQGHGLFEGSNGFLLTAAQQIVLSGHVMNDGYADQLDDQLNAPLACLRQSMDLVWRILGVWMTALALLLLIDVIT
jgi:AmpE protein